jgi:hypothetical protein
MTTTIRIDAATHRRLKATCARLRATAEQVIAAAMKQLDKLDEDQQFAAIPERRTRTGKRSTK